LNRSIQIKSKTLTLARFRPVDSSLARNSDQFDDLNPTSAPTQSLTITQDQTHLTQTSPAGQSACPTAQPTRHLARAVCQPASLLLAQPVHVCAGQLTRRDAPRASPTARADALLSPQRPPYPCHPGPLARERGKLFPFLPRRKAARSSAFRPAPPLPPTPAQRRPRVTTSGRNRRATFFLGPRRAPRKP